MFKLSSSKCGLNPSVAGAELGCAAWLPKPLFLLAIAVLCGVAIAQTGCVGITSAKTASSSNAADVTDNSGAPSITSQPVSQTVTSGQTATFSVSASGTAPLSYQWQLNGSAISGATGTSYTTPAETPSNNGARFSVIVSNSAGSATSSAAALTVNAATTAPSITTQPASQTITSGQTATFSVAASGTAPLSYQWQLNGSPISGATSATYTTPSETTSNNGAQFSVIVSNSAGNVTSNNATLTVSATAVAPSITTQPASQTISSGQTATFSVSASGTAPLSYQWQLNGSAISGATGTSYTTPAETTSNNGARFTVIVNNSAGSATSSAAVLTVNAATTAPSITTQPASQTITTGQTATFSVSALGSAPLSYQWQLNGAAISGATAATYTTPAETASNNGARFSAIVSNSAGSTTSSAAVLTVSTATVAPSITTQPASQTITSGQTATFFVLASGTAPLSYQWQLNGAAISGATAATYTTPAETTSNNGARFSVIVSNSAGSAASSAAVLTINAATTAPSITTQPVSQTITSGQTATFSVVSSGTAPLAYQWQLNGAAISGATSATYTTPAETTSNNGSKFSVVVSNSAGGVTSSTATLTVTAGSVAPSITTQPTSQTVTAGQTATFSIVATGTAPMSYQWQLNGSAISGATFATYTTPAETASNSGAKFSVVVSNSASSVTSSDATLTVNGVVGALNPSTTTLTFGSINIGSNNTLDVTLTNAGTAAISITGVTMTNGAGFNPSGISSGTIIAGGSQATLALQFAPSAAGLVNGSITITSTAANPSITVNFSGTGVQAASHSVSLNWTASTSSVSGYNVYRSTVSGQSYTQINTSLVTTTTFTDSSVTSGQTYYYVVTAVGTGAVQSGNSNQATATIP